MFQSRVQLGENHPDRVMGDKWEILVSWYSRIEGALDRRRGEVVKEKNRKKRDGLGGNIDYDQDEAML